MTNEYSILYEQSCINIDAYPKVTSRVSLILLNKFKYGVVAKAVQIPWWCVAAVHSLEASLNFNCHLHNGDPLSCRTTHSPQGRPIAPPGAGKLPYAWTESAIDALSAVWKPYEWGINGCLEFLERYNGLGYRKYNVNSPYLWGATSQYTKGLFIRDGQFDPEAEAKTLGGAAILKVLESRNAIQLN